MKMVGHKKNKNVRRGTMYLRQRLQSIPLKRQETIIQSLKTAPQTLTHADAMVLQRTIGNRAVNHLLKKMRTQGKSGKQAKDASFILQRKTDPNAPIQAVSRDKVYDADRFFLTSPQRRLLTIVKAAFENVDRWKLFQKIIAESPDETLEEKVENGMEVISKIETELEGIDDDIFDYQEKRNASEIEIQRYQKCEEIEERLGVLVDEAYEILRTERPVSKKFEDFMGFHTALDIYATGGSSDPIPITWYKTKADYKPIKLTQPDEQNQTDFTYPGGPILKDSRNGTIYDMSNQPSNPFSIGTVFRNHKDTDSRDVQSRVRETLVGYGFNHKGLDGDHIVDLGFGGEDKASNIWPLDEKINRRPFWGWRSLYGINYIDGFEGKTGTVNSLEGKYFRIKEHMSSGEGNVPEEGKRPDQTSGATKAPNPSTMSFDEGGDYLLLITKAYSEKVDDLYDLAKKISEM
jgi:hypothetical protein